MAERKIRAVIAGIRRGDGVAEQRRKEWIK
jgi:hypothetical protein